MRRCLVKGTRILMADGSECEIQEIRKGDRVFNPKNNTIQIVKNAWSGRERDIYQIRTVTGLEIEATYDHIFLTEKGIVEAQRLDKSDILFGKNAEPVAIERVISRLDWIQDIYNLTLGDGIDCGWMLANGLIVGDMNLENE